MVSILTRPEDRVQLKGRWASSSRWTCFNPHPARRPGATANVCVAIVKQARFQSSPGPKTGCNSDGIAMPLLVSEFQSSPGPKTGCNYYSSLLKTGNCPLFQSSPGPKTGCNALQLTGSGASLTGGFNPHPARRPGATPPVRHRAPPDTSFNPHPARRPGATTPPRTRRRPACPVSILTRPEDRVQRSILTGYCAVTR